jgi:hypothetical protein
MTSHYGVFAQAWLYLQLWYFWFALLLLSHLLAHLLASLKLMLMLMLMLMPIPMYILLLLLLSLLLLLLLLLLFSPGSWFLAPPSSWLRTPGFGLLAQVPSLLGGRINYACCLSLGLVQHETMQSIGQA